MAKRKKYKENENLDRWLLSYADFITLLFATFVVLYALSQMGISQFGQLENAIKNAFFNPINEIKEDLPMPYSEAEQSSLTNMLLMEYINPNYEQAAFEEIAKEINKLKSEHELENIDVKITDTGLIIVLKDGKSRFEKGSSHLTSKTKEQLDKIGVLISSKFVLHLIRVEGHTDSNPASRGKYPSAWDISSARANSIIRYFIDTFKFTPDLFSSVGYGNTRPATDNNTSSGRAGNCRVEIVILRNKLRPHNNAADSFLKLPKEEQKEIRLRQLQIIEKIDGLNENKDFRLKQKIKQHRLDITTTYKQEAMKINQRQ